LDDLIAQKKKEDLDVLLAQVNKYDSIYHNNKPLFINLQQASAFLVDAMQGLVRLLRSLKSLSWKKTHGHTKKITFVLQKTLSLMKVLARLDSLGNNNLFSFRQIFAKEECLKLLFELKIVDEGW
jgi:hypothetical protein